MKKIVSFLFSMLFTGILLVIFAIAIGYATFIENDFGTITAKILIYNSKWFEGLLILVCINLIGSIFENKLISKKKWTIFLFHVAFIVIIIGAGITRYYGFEGNMHIREGMDSNSIVSTESYIKIKSTDGDKTIEKETEVKFSPYTANQFHEKFHLNNHIIEVKNIQYLTSTIETVYPDPMGEAIISVIAVDQENQRVDFNLKKGTAQTINGITLGFDTSKNADINFNLSDKKAYFVASKPTSVFGMTQEQEEIIPAETNTEVNNQKVYSIGVLSFAVKQFLSKGKTQLEYVNPQNQGPQIDAIRILLTVDGISKEYVVFGKSGLIGIPMSISLNGIDVSVSYGSKRINLPFSIYLSDFQLERYPGSNSPSSYASEVILKDQDYEKTFRIFMNNILKYQGYRFFQSSYDTDEKGTILSVNHDSLGTSITYFGYFIMALGMLLTLFNKSSRFKKLVRASAKLRDERKKLFVLLVLGFFLSFSVHAQNQKINDLDKNHIREFEELIIQSSKGRVEPVSTIASEIVRKVSKKTRWEGMSPTEIFLDMQANPEKWKNIPFIKVSNSELRKIIGASDKHVSFNSIVAKQQMGGYKLSALVSAAYAKKSNERTKFDKEVMNVDERINILMSVFSGEFLTIFPVPGDNNHKWVSGNNINELDGETADFARQTILAYFSSVNKRDWATANQLLQNIKQNQLKNGAKIIPVKSKIKLEIIYNKLNIFGKLSKIFMFTGLILLIVELITLFNPRIKLHQTKKLVFLFISVLFIAETTGLGIRWYISGHAPWSNGYESMIFVSWATCLGGLIFAKRSEITLALTTVLSGLALMVAGMSWMSPEITNLVPVLQSYWLIIHVAIITASYGFLGIGALLGMLNLFLMVVRNKKNSQRVNFTIKELVNIIQITLMIGLLMVTVGSFLGGVWANESWGRYWGWDPKETWALVTIIVYTFIGHMYKIPGFRGNFAISAAALLGISSVLMTYFGVNYYLSGLHSYAQGEPAPIPSGVYIAIVVVFVLIVAAYMSEKAVKTFDENKDN